MTHPTTSTIARTPGLARDATPRSRRGILALAFTAGATLCAGSCAPLATAFGFRGAPSRNAPVVITNGLDQAVNVYVLPRTGIGERFVGLVAAGTTDTVQVRGVGEGATVRLRAAPVGGGTPYQQDGVVLGPAAAWRIP